MVFENEINIYNPDAIVNEFHTQATQISATQGKISAIISDSQIQELQSGNETMFSRLVSAEMNIDGISTQVSSLRQADGELESQISTIRQTAKEINLEVSSVKNNYAKKSQIILAINSITQESQTVISSDHISLAGKTINLTSDNIIIKSTYFNVDKDGRINATAGTFSGSLSAATGTFKGELSAATGTFAGSLSAASGTFKGKLQAATGSFEGSVTASSGNIGGFTIGSSSIYKTMNSLDSTALGVYIGTDGVALGGGKFKVKSNGAMSATDVALRGTVRSYSTSGAAYAELSSGELKFSSYHAAISGMWETSIYGSTSTMQFCDATSFEFVPCNESKTTRSMVVKIGFGGMSVQKDLSCTGNLNVSGTKNRVVSTDDYGKRLLYCYETPSPMFGDVGEGIISEDGECYVMIDSIFAETVSLNQYQVFLQKYGEGECRVSQKNSAYFVVNGTPGLAFGWELKAKQSDFDQYRLEKSTGEMSIENTINYSLELEKHIIEISKQREEAFAA